MGKRRKLSDSVMDGSIFLFDKLNFSMEWLDKPVSSWNNYESFREMETWVKNLKVKNDVAERAIKLISDYANVLTKDSEDRKNLLQVVEKQRSDFPDAKKSTMVKNLMPSTSKN